MALMVVLLLGIGEDVREVPERGPHEAGPRGPTGVVGIWAGEERFDGDQRRIDPAAGATGALDGGLGLLRALLGALPRLVRRERSRGDALQDEREPLGRLGDLDLHLDGGLGVVGGVAE